MKAANIPVSEQWASVRLRIHQIQSAMETIANELKLQSETATDDVVERLGSLQDKFEKVMGQLATFDDEGDDGIRRAKEEFAEIVERYRISKKNGKAPVH